MYTTQQRRAYGLKMRKQRAGVVSGYGAYRVKTSVKPRAPRRARVARVPKQVPNSGWMPGLGSAIGRGLGTLAGFPSVGASVGNYLGRVTGLGEYKVKRNTILMPDPPTVSNTNSGVRIKHREYIQDVQSSILFNNQLQLPLQPGLYQTFPWLSGIAANFTQYKFHGLIFEFISTSGSAIASTNNSLGEVMLATNYNSGDATFSNKQQMLNEEFSGSSVPSVNLVHPIECAASQTTIERLYTRSTAVPSGQDIRLYDMGLTQLAVQGQQVGTGIGGVTSINLGELYCSYDIEFFKPQLDEYEGITNLGSHVQLPATTTTATVPLGATQVIKYDSIGVTFNGATGTIMTIPEGFIGNYLLTYSIVGSQTSTLVPPGITLTNATFLKLWNSDVNASSSAPVGGSDQSTTIVLETAFSITNPSVPTTVIFGGAGTFPASITTGDLILVQLPFYMTV